MLLPPHSWHPDVWTDVAQMLSMNTLQSAAGAEKHICPLPFDIVDRLIRQRSMPGELVFDPFGGLGTVPYRALKLGRRGACVELNADYFLAACKYVEAMAREKAMPTLFDLTGERQSEAAA
jgi:DNA modification methylase